MENQDEDKSNLTINVYFYSIEEDYEFKAKDIFNSINNYRNNPLEFIQEIRIN